jgi:hypothetical protein
MRKNTALGIVVWLAAALAAWAQPLAYVYEHQDERTKTAHAAELLTVAGFRAESLPLDTSPRELGEAQLIVLGTFVSDHPRYAEYMKAHAAALREWVEAGGVLLQFAQADQKEKTPSFLSPGLRAVRGDVDASRCIVLSPERGLLRAIAAREITFHTSRTMWDGFTDQSGFEVLIAGEVGSQHPALMEAAVGKGRVILSAIALDKDVPPPGERIGETVLEAFRASFFKGLREHVAEVRAGTAPALAPTPPPQKPWEYTKGAWTLAVLPDTQNYSTFYPGLYAAQTGWIVANKERLDIRYVIHLGDVVNNNSAAEYRKARDAMKLLEGVVSYAMVPGNHDYGPGGNARTRETLLNEFFPFDSYAAQPGFGGAMEEGRIDNTYHQFEAGGRKWIVVCLEWGPRDAAVAWANRVMEDADAQGRTGILVTHAYMNNNDRRFDHTDKDHSQEHNPHNYKTEGGVNDGEELWQKLVRKHNFAITLNGHVLGDGTGYLLSANDRGGKVHQILSNYQFRNMGGEGYLRLMEFQPDGKTVRVKTYSPVFDRWMTARDQQFEFELE